MLARARQIGATLAEVALERLRRRTPDDDHPLLVPLAAHAHQVLAQVDARDVEADDLGEAQPGGVHQLQDRAVAQAEGFVGVGGLYHGGELVLAQYLRQPAFALGAADAHQRVALQVTLAHEVAVEGVDGAHLAADAGGGCAGLMQVPQVAPEGLPVHLKRPDPLFPFQVAPEV